MTPQERIRAEAEAYASQFKYGFDYRKPAYIDGATAENSNATKLYDALMELFALKELKDKHGKTPEYLKRQPIAWQKAKEALNKWKGKEVDKQAETEGCPYCGSSTCTSDHK